MKGGANGKSIETWVGRSEFDCEGSVAEGTRILYGKKPYSVIYQQSSTGPCWFSQAIRSTWGLAVILLPPPVQEREPMREELKKHDQD